MSHKIDDNPPLPRSRVRELVAAHEDAVLQWSVLSGASRHPEDSSSSTGTSQLQRLQEQQDGALMALLEEGMPEDRWVAISREECALIEDGFQRPELRRAPRKAVSVAPEWVPAKVVESKARRLVQSLYHEPMSVARSLSAYLSVLTTMLFAVGGLIHIVATEISPGAEYQPLALLAAIVPLGFWAAYRLADALRPDTAEQVLAEEREVYGPDAAADKAVQLPVSECAYEPRSGPGQLSLEEFVAEARRGMHLWNTQSQELVEVFVERPDSMSWPPLLPQRAGHDDQWAPNPALSHGATDSGATGTSAGLDPDPNDLHHRQQRNRRAALEKVAEEDLSESFSSAQASLLNSAGGFEPVQLMEARGELADVLGIAQGELVAQLRWSPRRFCRPCCSFLPYREVVVGTSLDPARPPAERVRPGTREALHELLIAEKGLGSLSPKVTYRVGPNSQQFFNIPYLSAGEDGAYLLEDKLEYLLQRACELGFEEHYTEEEWDRIEEIMLGDGYAPTHEELLRFALVGGIDPRFLFEDSREDLRTSDPHTSKPKVKRLWRIEAAISEAHGIPVEVFERNLVSWHYSLHAWSFR